MPNAILRDKPRIASAILDHIRAQSPGNASKLLNQTFEGNSPLHFGLQENPGLVPILLEYGAHVDAPDARGVLPIQFAAQHNLGSMVKILAEKGSNVDSKGRWSTSPLVIALENQSMEAASVLLDMGANTEGVTKSLILLPRTTELDHGIQEMKPTDSPWPLCSKDIYQICLHFKGKFFLPIPVTARIFDMAGLCVQSSVIRHDVQEYEHSTGTYLRSAPIVGRELSPVQKIAFSITSHDQGFDSNKVYSGNWTWFESRRLPRGNSKRGVKWPVDCHIKSNRHAVFWWHLHQITWFDSETFRNWQQVKPGDRISILASARFPAWRNFVGNARIDIFTSILRCHYTENEVFEIWDTTRAKYLRRSNTFKHAMPKPEPPVLLHMLSDHSRLQILSAEYGTSDVTRRVTELVINNQSLELDTDVLNEYFGDTWPNVQKNFTCLYRFNSEEPRLCITAENRGALYIDTDVDGSKAGLIPKPIGAVVHILAIVYGTREVTSTLIYEKMYTAIAQEKSILINNENLGGVS